jgi:uncharacterized Fe-S cluster-containing radical SAM superfamily protein
MSMTKQFQSTRSRIGAVRFVKQIEHVAYVSIHNVSGRRGCELSAHICWRSRHWVRCSTAWPYFNPNDVQGVYLQMSKFRFTRPRGARRSSSWRQQASLEF